MVFYPNHLVMFAFFKKNFFLKLNFYEAFRKKPLELTLRF